MPFVAPWLQPTDVLGAIRAGSGVGLQIRQQDAAEQAAAARLMQAQIEQQQQQQAQAIQQQQAAERLRQSQQEMFNQARQQEIANQIRGDAADLDRQKFDEAQATQSRLEEANKLFGSTLATGLSGEKPDILGAFSKAASVAPGAVAVQKLDADALINAQNRRQMSGQSEAALIRLEQQSGIPIPRLPDGTPDPVAFQTAITKTAHLADLGKMTPVEKRAGEFSDSIKKINPDVSDEDLKGYVNEFISSNGQSAMIPQNEMKVIASGDVLAVGLQKALDGVKAFNDKYGKGAFDQFTGPIDSRLAALERKIKRPLDDSDKAAVTKILQGVNQVSQTYRLGNFGTQLSATEQKQFEKIIANPDSASFLTTLEGALDSTKGILANKMSVYPYAQNPGMNQFRSRYGENAASKSSTQNGSTSPSAASQGSDIPPENQRKVGQSYTNRFGVTKTWTGTGWK